MTNDRLAAEMLATADSSLQYRWQVAFLVQAGILHHIEDDATETVMQHGLAVADALQALAQQITEK